MSTTGSSHTACESALFRVWHQAAVDRTSAQGRVSRASPGVPALRNCTRDEGGPFGFGDQEPISSHRKLLWSKAMVVLCQEGARAPCGTRDEGGPFGAVL